MSIKDIYDKVREKKIHVLIVEDDDDLALEFKELLEELYFKADIVSNGIEALDKYKSYYNETQRHYDIVITDIIMPFMNGVELVESLLKENSEQVIIVVSANKESEQLIPLINMKVEQFIKKPIVFDEFIQSIDNALRKLLTISDMAKLESRNPLDLGDRLYWYEEDGLLLNQDDNIKLTHNEQILLKLLLKNPNRVFSNEDICNYLGNGDLNAQSVKHLILRLRKKIPKELIESVYGVGYKAVYKSV